MTSKQVELITITAQQFVDEGYAEKVKRGECVVICNAEDLIDEIHFTLSGSHIIYFKYNDNDGISRNSYRISPSNEQFTVEWLPTLATNPVAEGDTANLNKLFTDVQDTLEMALRYLPGELAEFPAKVQSVVDGFRNYCNLAEKQIQDLQQQLAASRQQLVTAEVALKEIYRMAEANADGHDEINEDTPDAYISLLEHGLDAIRHEANAALGQLKAADVPSGG